MAGMKIEIEVDREFCQRCEAVLPDLAFELGIPIVTVRDPYGFNGTLHNGQWRQEVNVKAGNLLSRFSPKVLAIGR